MNCEVIFDPLLLPIIVCTLNDRSLHLPQLLFECLFTLLNTIYNLHSPYITIFSDTNHLTGQSSGTHQRHSFIPNLTLDFSVRPQLIYSSTPHRRLCLTCRTHFRCITYLVHGELLNSFSVTQILYSSPRLFT